MTNESMYDLHSVQKWGCMGNRQIIIGESVEIHLMCVLSFDQAGETFLLPGLNLSDKLSDHRYHLM